MDFSTDRFWDAVRELSSTPRVDAIAKEAVATAWAVGSEAMIVAVGAS